MSEENVTLHIVQDVATPHNNSLICALRELPNLRVVTWYAVRGKSHLPWKKELGGGGDNYYLDTWPNRLRFIRTFFFQPSAKYLVIGWSNFGSRFILCVSWLLRRDFMYWTDNPEDRPRSLPRFFLRKVCLHIVKNWACPIFAVGRHTVVRFRKLGLPQERLVNLPIFIDLPSLPEKNMEEIAEVRKKYGIGPNEVFFVAASRLTYNKGYDLILEALRLQDQIHRKRMKILIVGQGPEKEKLKRLTNQYGLNGRVGFEDWLEPEAYERVIRAADVFLHPARFDAFGGGTLYAMALAVPVIGSDGAGSVLERVEHGISGLIYKAEDIQALADCMVRMIDQPQERICMGRKARETAEQWSPSRGAIIIKQALGVPLHLPEQ